MVSEMSIRDRPASVPIAIAAVNVRASAFFNLINKPPLFHTLRSAFRNAVILYNISFVFPNCLCTTIVRSLYLIAFWKTMSNLMIRVVLFLTYILFENIPDKSSKVRAQLGAKQKSEVTASAMSSPLGYFFLLSVIYRINFCKNSTAVRISFSGVSPTSLSTVKKP